MRSDDAADQTGAGHDAVCAALTPVLELLSGIASTGTSLDEAAVGAAARIDRIALLERLRALVAAAQHAEIVAFARAQVAEHIASGEVDPAAVGRGIADQVALACHVPRRRGRGG